MKSPSNESNSVLELIRKIQLLLPNGDDNLAQRVVAVKELVAFLEAIVRSPSTSDCFFYFLEHGAATSWLLQVDLMQPEASVYRALKRLRRMDVIVDAIKIQKMKGSKGGPRPVVWALQGAATEDVARAMRNHYRAMSPKYRVAEKFVQTVIKDHLKRNTHIDGIRYRQILILAQDKVTPYHSRDIAELAATILHEKGVKVWR